MKTTPITAAETPTEIAFVEAVTNHHLSLRAEAEAVKLLEMGDANRHISNAAKWAISAWSLASGIPAARLAILTAEGKAAAQA